VDLGSSLVCLGARWRWCAGIVAEEAVKLEYLRQCDLILNKCGRPQLPGGVSAVPLTRGFVLPMVLQPGGAVTYTKEITGGSPWVLRAISSDKASASLMGIRCQIQLPNGRFLFGGNGVDIGQFAWIGSWKWLQDPELRCESGGKLQVTLTDTTSGGLAAATPVNLLFEGADLMFMRGGRQISPPAPLASSLPRYQGVVNENILAPAWASNEGLQTPKGYVDEHFVYSTAEPVDQPLQATWTIAGGVVTVQPDPLPFEIQITPGYEMFVQRMLFDLQLTGTAAIVLGKLRTGAGYVLNNSFIDLARYLCGAEYAGQFRVKGGDSVFIDAALADFSGDGTVTLQVFLEGYRRRRA
jgi:hypothetical protein